jgi:hypothetical protein
MAEASKGLETVATREKIVETVRAGRRRFVSPIPPDAEQESEK